MATKNATTRTTRTQQKPRRSFADNVDILSLSLSDKAQFHRDSLIKFAIAAMNLGHLEADKLPKDRAHEKAIDKELLSAASAFLEMVGGEAPERMISSAIEGAIETSRAQLLHCAHKMLRAGFVPPARYFTDTQTTLEHPAPMTQQAIAVPYLETAATLLRAGENKESLSLAKTAVDLLEDGAREKAKPSA